MGLVLMCPASDTRHSPTTCARRWSRSFRASTSSKTSPWRSLRVLSTRRSRQKERVTRISVRTSSATTSGAISTSKSRIHLFRIRESVKSRHPYGSKVGGELLCRLSAAQCLFEDFPLLLSYFGHFGRCIEHLCRPVATLRESNQHIGAGRPGSS